MLAKVESERGERERKRGRERERERRISGEAHLGGLDDVK